MTHNNSRSPGFEELAEILRSVLLRKIAIRTGDRVRTIPAMEVACEAVLDRALRGDHGAFEKLLILAEKLNALAPPEATEKSRETGDVLEELLSMSAGVRERLWGPSWIARRPHGWIIRRSAHRSRFPTPAFK
jgi:Family of unknown function (DUF5681)